MKRVKTISRMNLNFDHLDGMYKSPPEVGTFCQASILRQRGKETIANSNSYITSGEEKKSQGSTVSQPLLCFTQRGYTRTEVT